MAERAVSAPPDASRPDLVGSAPAGVSLLPADVAVLAHVAARAAVRRHGVLRRLESLPYEVCLVLLAAPVGSGKTTAVRQWVESDGHRFGRRFGWLRLTDAHSDPARLLPDLALTLGRLGVPADEGPASTLDPDLAVSRLAAAVRRRGRPVVLVLDDVNRLRARRSLDLVAALAEELPPGSRIMALADHRPRLRTSRLLAEGRYVELGGDDLAFTRDETQAYLEQVGLDLPADAVDELLRRTEGWAQGLRLAASVLGQTSDPAAAVWRFTGEADEVADYFRHEVLARRSPDLVRFLMRTAVLGSMSGALCDAVLRTTGSAAWTAETHALGLFATPLDDRGEWYRYHRLFGEMLRAELRRREPGADLTILRRAAAWFEQQGCRVEAIEHAIAGRGAFTAARLIVAHTQYLTSRGEIDQVRRWLDQLDEDTLELYPPLAVMAGWVWALTGDAARARAALRTAEGGSFEGPLPDGSVSLESAIVRLRAALAVDGVERMLLDAQRAVDLEPPGSPWHTMAALHLGAAAMVNGHDENADRWLEHSARFGRAEQASGALTALAESALHAAERGDWSMAEVCLAECVQLRDAGHLQHYMPSLLTNLAGAFVALHTGDTRRALAETHAALALYEAPSPAAFPWLAVQAAVGLGHLFLTLGDRPAAERKLAEARSHLAVLPTAGVLPAWVGRLADAVESAREESTVAEDSTLTTAELRVLRLLPTHLPLGGIADQLVVSRNTVKSQVAAIYRKLGAENRAEAVRSARERGLLEEALPGNRPGPSGR